MKKYGVKLSVDFKRVLETKLSCNHKYLDTKIDSNQDFIKLILFILDYHQESLMHGWYNNTFILVFTDC